MLTEEDKQWISERLEKVETTLLTESSERLGKVETTLLAEFSERLEKVETTLLTGFSNGHPQSNCVSGAMPQPFARWILKLSLCQTGSSILKAADRSLVKSS